MASSQDPAGRDWLGELPDDVVLLVFNNLPPGPVGRGDVRMLSQRFRDLANSTVTKVRVEDWDSAALMGSTFPQLEELIVRYSQPGMEGVFLQHSAPQLTRLVSLKAPWQFVTVQLMEHLCSGMPRLRRLSLGRVPLSDLPGSPPPVLEVITQLVQLTALKLQAVGVTKEALALLQGLPNLHSLDLEDSELHNKQLAGLEGLTGLGALNLSSNEAITVAGLQALLPQLQLLTSLELLWVDLGEEGFQLLAQLPGLRHLVVKPYNGVYDGITQLTRLQHLSMLGAPRWEVKCNERGVAKLLCSSSLRVLHVNSVSKEAAGPQVCQVTELEVWQLIRSMPLLPKLAKVVIGRGCALFGANQLGALLQHTTITELVLGGAYELIASELGCLALLPQLRALTLKCESDRHQVLTDAVLPSALRRCTGLERLTLVNLPQLTDQGLEGVARGLPSLCSLEVQRCRATTAAGHERALRVVTRAAGARGC